MAVELPCAVWVWFGAPIHPTRCGYPPGMARLDVTDPPLLVDELPGLLTAWQHTRTGWRAQVEYGAPVHGYGLGLRRVGWFPADRVRVGA